MAQQARYQSSSNQPLNHPHPNNSAVLMSSNNVFTLEPYKFRKDNLRTSVVLKYDIIGYIAAGTYGRYVFTTT